MTHDELQTKLEELETLIKTGGDFALVETLARELLAILRTFPHTDLVEGNEVESTALQQLELVERSEVKVRTLLALSQSLWRRGIVDEALPYAEEALNF